MNGYPLVTLIMAIAFSLVTSQSYLFRVYAIHEEKLEGIEFDDFPAIKRACELTDEKTEMENSASQIPGSIAGQDHAKLTEQNIELVQHCKELKKSLLGDLDKKAEYLQNKNTTKEIVQQRMDKVEQTIVNNFKKEWAESFCMPNCK